MKPVKLLFSLMMCASLVFSLAACKEKKAVPEDEILCYNITYEPDTLDPQIANDSASRLIIRNIFEGLVRLDENETPCAGVAEFWNVSNHEMTYTFYLRDNAHWQNGDRVTAENFRYGLCRAIMPSTGSPTASTLFCIKNADRINRGELPLSELGVKALDATTLKIELEYPDSDFLTLMASPPAMPCHQQFFEETAGQYGREADKLLSNGAFYIRSSGWEHDKSINLRKNPEYGGKDVPVPAGVNIVIGESPANVCDAILSEELDCYALPGSEVARAQENALNLTSFGDTVWGIAFNTQNEVLAHSEIRRALLSALDRNYLLSSLPDGCTAGDDLIPASARMNGASYREQAGSGFSIAYSSTAKADLQKAMTKLKIDELPKMTILCTNDEATQKIVNNMIETWNKVTGSYLNKNPVSLAELKDDVSDGSFRVVVAPLTAGGDDPINTLSLFTSDSSYNPAQLHDTAYDEMVGKLMLLPEQNALYATIEAEKYLQSNGVFYPLYTESRYYAAAPNVTGIIFHPYGGEVDFFYATKTRDD